MKETQKTKIKRINTRQQTKGTADHTWLTKSVLMIEVLPFTCETVLPNDKINHLNLTDFIIN